MSKKINKFNFPSFYSGSNGRKGNLEKLFFPIKINWCKIEFIDFLLIWRNWITAEFSIQV